MRLTRNEKRTVENELVTIINQHPNGIDTRVLISSVMTAIVASIPNANRHHVSGMLSWVWKNYNYTFLVRTPGYSVIA
jgi:hypothetical protein